MPDYAKDVTIETHYIIIEQDSTHSLVVEEQIWFKNNGEGNHSEKLYVFSQPSDILNQIYKFGFDFNGTYKPVKVYPSVNFLVTNLSDNNLSIGPGETYKLVFQYLLSYSSAEEYTFRKTFLYNNSEILIIITPNENFNVKGDENVKLIYDSTAKRYATQHADTLSMEFGESLVITFSKKAVATNGDPPDNNEEFDYNIVLYLLLIGISIIIIAVFLGYRSKKAMQEEKRRIAEQERRKNQAGKKKGTHRKSRKPETIKPEKKPVKTKPMGENKRDKFIKDKKKLLKTTNRLKSDYKEGLISKESYDKLRVDYKQKLKTINKKIERLDKQGDGGTDIETEDESQELKRLQAKKEKILKAINKLEDDREAGIIDDELYDEMAGTYKKQAIEIMQSIDQVRENEL
jgi:hypothetical protein